MKKKMIVLSDWYEPAYKAGGSVRSCVNFVLQMNDIFDLFVLTGDRDLGEVSAYEGIESDKWLMRNGAMVRYISPEQLGWKQLMQEINQIGPDYLYINSMYSRYFTIYPLAMKWLNRIKASVVLAPCGMLKDTAMQYKSFKKLFFLTVLNIFGIPRKITFLATDQTEENDVKRIFGNRAITEQIPNFPPSQLPLQKITKLRGELNMIFVGRIHPIKNLLFVLKCLLNCKNNIALTVVGDIADEAYYEECTKIVAELPAGIKVNFKYEVPHEIVTNLMINNHLFILPTLGENFGYAIFEAISVGRPVLISDQTPWKNLEHHKTGWDIPLNNMNAFIDRIEQVAHMDNETYQFWCVGAWNHAEEFSKKSEIKARYLHLFSQ